MAEIQWDHPATLLVLGVREEKATALRECVVAWQDLSEPDRISAIIECDAPIALPGH